MTKTKRIIAYQRNYLIWAYRKINSIFLHHTYMNLIVVPVTMYDSNMTTISPLAKKLQRIKDYFPNMVITSINRLDGLLVLQYI